MMNKALFILVFFFSGFIFAQDATISVRPKNFKNTILFKADLKEKTAITISFFDADEIVKQLNFSDIEKTVFKIDLKGLPHGKEYTVKVYNSENELLFTDKIIKSLK